MITKLDHSQLDQLLLDAASAPRRRAHLLLHRNHQDPVQRLVIALMPGSYVRPHLHRGASRWEMILALRGEITLVLFNPDGEIVEKLELAPNGALPAVELPPASWHSLYANSPDAVIMEIKPGPFAPIGPDDFARWAPPEESDAIAEFMSWMRSATVGQRYPG